MDRLQVIHENLQGWLDDARKAGGNIAALKAVEARLVEVLGGLAQAAGRVDLHELLSLWMLLIQELTSQAALAQGVAAYEERLRRVQDWTAQAADGLLQGFHDRSLRACAATRLEVTTVLAQYLTVEGATPIATRKLIQAAHFLTSNLNVEGNDQRIATVTFEQFGGRTFGIESAFADSGEDLGLSGKRQVSASGGSGACRKIKTFFVTFRNIRQRYKNPYLTYGNKWAQQTTYGVSEVSIPLSRLTYSLHRKYSFESGDVRKHREIERGEYFVLESVKPLDEEKFYPQLMEEIDKGTLMVFVHGFRQTHADALIHAAQVFHDLSLKGAPLVLSWPSGFILGSKSYDDAIDEFARKKAAHAFATIIGRAARSAGADNILLIGHSLGCRALCDICQSLELTDKRFTHIVLASPDIELKKFPSAVKPAANAKKRITVYASRSDRALQFASWVYGDRAGAHPSRLSASGYENFEVVATEGCFFDYPDFWRHSDFSCGAGSDLLRAIQRQSPQKRRLEQRKASEGHYWAIS